MGFIVGRHKVDNFNIVSYMKLYVSVLLVGGHLSQILVVLVFIATSSYLNKNTKV